MLVHYVLFVCPTWSALRAGILSDCRTIDLCKLLNDYKGAKTAIKFVLQTDLLAQFRLIASSEQANCTGLPDLASDFNANDEHYENENKAENKQDIIYPSSGNIGIIQTESTL